jgi:hypothetical protein
MLGKSDNKVATDRRQEKMRGNTEIRINHTMQLNANTFSPSRQASTSDLTTMGNDFVFIHVREPKDALKLAKDSHIRSHVTRRQWKQFEERSQAAFQRDLKKAKTETPWNGDRQDKQHLVSGEIVRHSQPTGAAQPVYFGLPIPRPFGGLRGDPFRSYPVAWRPILPRLVDHCTYSNTS